MLITESVRIAGTSVPVTSGSNAPGSFLRKEKIPLKMTDLVYVERPESVTRSVIHNHWSAVVIDDLACRLWMKLFVFLLDIGKQICYRSYISSLNDEARDFS